MRRTIYITSRTVRLSKDRRGLELEGKIAKTGVFSRN